MRLLFILVLFIPLHAFAKDDLWNGWYVGGAGGKQKTDVDAVWNPHVHIRLEESLDEEDQEMELNFIDDETIDSTLFKVGHYWNRQPWILGLEFNYFNNSLEEFETSLVIRQTIMSTGGGFSRIENFTAEFGFSVEPLWALMGKAGYLIQDDLLIYGLLGATQMEINGVTMKYSTETIYLDTWVTSGGFSQTFAAPNDTNLFLTAGIGLEYHLASSWSVNAEYRLVNMSNIVAPSYGGTDFDHATIDDLSSLTMGINYHF